MVVRERFARQPLHVVFGDDLAADGGELGDQPLQVRVWGRDVLHEGEVGEDGAPARVGSVFGVGEGGGVEDEAEERFDCQEDALLFRAGRWLGLLEEGLAFVLEAATEVEVFDVDGAPAAAEVVAAGGEGGHVRR